MSREYLVPLKLPADPTVALEAATKQYVDAHVVSYIILNEGDPVPGGTPEGTLVLVIPA